jgi:hypothetical protein
MQKIILIAIDCQSKETENETTLLNKEMAGYILKS